MFQKGNKFSKGRPKGVRSKIGEKVAEALFQVAGGPKRIRKTFAILKEEHPEIFWRLFEKADIVNKVETEIELTAIEPLEIILSNENNSSSGSE